MKPQALDWMFLDTEPAIDAGELCVAAGLSPEELDELVGYGALAPVAADPPGSRTAFSAACLVHLRVAARLRRDYDVDLFTVALALGYLQRIDTLEHEVRTLRAQIGPRLGA